MVTSSRQTLQSGLVSHSALSRISLASMAANQRRDELHLAGLRASYYRYGHGHSFRSRWQISDLLPWDADKRSTSPVSPRRRWLVKSLSAWLLYPLFQVHWETRNSLIVFLPSFISSLSLLCFNSFLADSNVPDVRIEMKDEPVQSQYGHSFFLALYALYPPPSFIPEPLTRLKAGKQSRTMLLKAICTPSSSLNLSLKLPEKSTNRKSQPNQTNPIQSNPIQSNPIQSSPTYQIQSISIPIQAKDIPRNTYLSKQDYNHTQEPYVHTLHTHIWYPQNVHRRALPLHLQTHPLPPRQDMSRLTRTLWWWARGTILYALACALWGVSASCFIFFLTFSVKAGGCEDGEWV